MKCCSPSDVMGDLPCEHKELGERENDRRRNGYFPVNPDFYRVQGIRLEANRSGGVVNAVLVVRGRQVGEKILLHFTKSDKFPYRLGFDPIISFRYGVGSVM